MTFAVGDGVVGGIVGNGVVGGAVGVVGDSVGDGEGDGVGNGVVGTGVGDSVGNGVGEGVGGFAPVHRMGGTHCPSFKHAGHSAPSVHSEFGERSQLLLNCPSILQIPVPAPVKLLSFNDSMLRAVSNPISLGIGPVSWLLFKNSV